MLITYYFNIDTYINDGKLTVNLKNKKLIYDEFHE